jgi:hypothetical protein
MPHGAGHVARHHRCLPGNDLTFASSIAYYSLLSLSLLPPGFSIIASVTGRKRRASVLRFVCATSQRFHFVTKHSTLQQAPIRLSVAGSVLMIWAAWACSCDHLRHQPCLGVGSTQLRGAQLISFQCSSRPACCCWSVSRWSRPSCRQVALVRRGPCAPALLVLGHRDQVGQHRAFIFVVGLVFTSCRTRSQVQDVWVGAVMTGLWARLAGFSIYVRDLSASTSCSSFRSGGVLVWIYIAVILLSA